MGLLSLQLLRLSSDGVRAGGRVGLGFQLLGSPGRRARPGGRNGRFWVTVGSGRIVQGTVVGRLIAQAIALAWAGENIRCFQRVMVAVFLPV